MEKEDKMKNNKVKARFKQVKVDPVTKGWEGEKKRASRKKELKSGKEKKKQKIYQSQRQKSNW